MESRKASSDEDFVNDTLPEANARGRLSVKDAGVILSMSTLLTIGLVMSTVGLGGISDRYNQSFLEFATTLSVFICLFAFTSYLLVRIAAHYLVYLAVRIFCALIFPVSQRRQRGALKDIYSKAEKRG